MDARKLLSIMLGISVAAAAGCSAGADDTTADDGPGTSEDHLRPLERKAIGKAVDYPADKSMRDNLEALTASRKLRREAAWKAVGRVLTPIKVTEGALKNADKSAATIPMFRTWYGKDDFERMFGKMIADRTADDRKARRPFTATDAKQAFDWNATSLGASSDKDYFDRIHQVDNDVSLQGLGGNHRVAYSPAIISHLMGQYGSLFDCLPKLDANAFKPDAEPDSKTNFAPCYTQEFPDDAALVKMSWYRANFGDEHLTLPTYDTSANTIAAKMNRTTDDGAWGKGVGEADPADAAIYTVNMADGTKFRMPAMHIVTKELREWLWITIWWSDKPNEDFGADRPDAISKLDGPWKNYKMNVSVSYEEKDPDPRGGFEGSLGDSLAASYMGVGKPSWVSNPYLEKGAPNAQSNCIGCHQHAGTNETSESILAAPDKFPQAARTRVRKNFPTDYLWAVANAPERLGGVIEDQVKHYDEVDR